MGLLSLLSSCWKNGPGEEGIKGLVDVRFRAFPSYGMIRGVEQGWMGRRLELRTEGKGCGCPTLCIFNSLFPGIGLLSVGTIKGP